MPKLLLAPLTKEDKLYRNGQLGQRGYITTLSVDAIEERGCYLWYDVPYWVDVSKLPTISDRDWAYHDRRK